MLIVIGGVIPIVIFWRLEIQDIIGETIEPFRLWLEGLQHRMAVTLGVLAGVFVGGIVAAAHLSAGQTQAQINPLATHFQTLFTSLGIWPMNLSLLNVSAGVFGISHLPFNVILCLGSKHKLFIIGD